MISASTMNNAQRYYLSPGKPRCKGTSRWMWVEPGDQRCRFPAQRDGYCKRHHPEYLIESTRKRIEHYERLLNEDRVLLKAQEAQWNEMKRERETL